jgi:methyl-accepting chemotaxis protein
MAETDDKKIPLIWRRLRGKMIVDKKTQLSMIAYIFLVAFFSSTLLQITLTLNQNIIATYESNSMPLVLSWVASYLFIGLIIFLALVVSNQFVGPIYRIRQHMKKTLETGDFSPVVIRKDDQFQNLAEEYNEFLKFIENNYRKK